MKRIALSMVALATVAQAQDPRVGLSAGDADAGQALSNLELVATRPRPAGFSGPPGQPGDFGYLNSDLAFQRDLLFQGNFRGFQIWDISRPSAPRIRKTFVCPGGQGDLSVHGNLLFMSVEETRGRLDCGTESFTRADSVSAQRFRGVRIFDVSDLDNPRQVAAIQTCRGSHTHTLVPAPNDTSVVYVYVSGTAGVRSPNELAGCVPSPRDPNTSLFRIEVIRVPLADPQDARVVSMPRIFADSTGAVAGLWRGGTHGPGTQATEVTDMCHDITVYPEVGLAAGACSGNGILLDVSDPENPRRIDEVMDPNFAYWHSATFNNDATKVLFTDEWGGGVAARCRATDRPEWGADAIFTLHEGKLRFGGYYKIPAPQTAAENCVAHNGSLIPVPGRDIMIQAWYQGGISVVDFTDPREPVEIAYFDRGPIDSTELVLGGAWSSYWYNGYIYTSEIGRGLDVLALKPSQFLSQNEIDAAKLVRMDVFNPQVQTKIVWPASFVVARAYLDGLLRADGLRRPWIEPIRAELTRAERLTGQARRTALRRLATRVEGDAAASSDETRVRALATTLRDLAEVVP